MITVQLNGVELELSVKDAEKLVEELNFKINEYYYSTTNVPDSEILYCE